MPPDPHGITPSSPSDRPASPPPEFEQPEASDDAEAVTAPLPAAAPEAECSERERPGPERAAWAGALLVALLVPPAAVLAIPDTSLNVMASAAQALGLDAGRIPALARATGLALPALVLCVPVAAVTARRFPARLVLLAGVALLLAGLAAARFADSVAFAGTVRVAQGAGAGIALPASLVVVWERGGRWLSALWAGSLAAALMAAMPLALRAVPATVPDGTQGDWRRALAPYVWPAAVAGAAAFGCLVARGRRRLPALRHNERGQLVLPLAPAAGFAFLAVVTTYGWSPGARLVVAGAAGLALLGLALVGSRDATAGSPLACAVVMVSAGLLAYPLASPLAGLVTAARAQEGGNVPVAPFAAAGAAALLGAVATVRLSRDGARTAVLAGHGLIVVAVLLGLAVGAGTAPLPLTAPLVPLGAGVGVALAASFRDANVGGALFGLSLCFPAVLTGQMLVLSLQAARLERLRPVNEAQQLHGLTDGYRVWLVAAGVAAVLLAAAARWAGNAREVAGTARGTASGTADVRRTPADLRTAVADPGGR